MANPPIRTTQFAHAFQRFLDAVRADPKSPGPFTDFQHGLPLAWEGYKEGVYHKARERLEIGQWRASSFGKGQILNRVIKAIEVKDFDGFRNNLLEWESKGRPPEAVTHAKLLAARNSEPTRLAADQALFRMFAEKASPAECFAALTDLFGARYDLIAYLFFLRDWYAYMPVRPTVFAEAFDILGVPLKMSGRCSWENYQEYLARLREVQRHLKNRDIPGEVRLLDAHSFCWMLARLPPAPAAEERQVVIIAFNPVAGEAPVRSKGQSGFSQMELEKIQGEQRVVGALAQAVVLDAEQKRLRDEGRLDLAERVLDVSDDTSLGYDIESFSREGAPKRIEVKAAAHRGGDLRFFLSENERKRSREIKGYTIALVTDVQCSAPRVYECQGLELPEGALHPVNYEVRLRNPNEE